MIYYLPLLMTVGSNLFYHILQKNTPNGVNPFLSLALTYSCALLLVIILYFVSNSGKNIVDQLIVLNISSFLLGIVIVGIEVGFLFVYRMGWNMSLASISSNILVAILLIPIGAYYFGQNISFYNVFGFAFCVVGLVLLNLK